MNLPFADLNLWLCRNPVRTRLPLPWRTLRRARDHIDRNYREPGVPGAGVSNCHFARSFAATSDETPIRYLLDTEAARAPSDRP